MTNHSFVLAGFLFSCYIVALVLAILAKFEIGIFKQPVLIDTVDIDGESQTFRLDPKCKKVAYVCVVPNLPDIYYPYNSNLKIMVAVFDKITNRSRFQEKPFVWGNTYHRLNMPTSADCFVIIKLDKLPYRCKAYVYGHC